MKTEKQDVGPSRRGAVKCFLGGRLGLVDLFLDILQMLARA